MATPRMGSGSCFQIASTLRESAAGGAMSDVLKNLKQSISSMKTGQGRCQTSGTASAPQAVCAADIRPIRQDASIISADFGVPAFRSCIPACPAAGKNQACAPMSAALQHTLAGPATLEGTSLHTGEKVSLTLKAAPEGHGFKFRRIDLPDQPFINADVDKVQTVERATTLAEGSVKVHTVEHVISALTGMGVDNALDRDGRQRTADRRRLVAAVRGNDQEGRDRRPDRAAPGLGNPRADPSGNRRWHDHHHRAVQDLPGLGHQRRPGRTLHPVFLHRGHARDLREGNLRGAHLRLLRGRQAAVGKRPDQGRLAGKRRRHPRQRDHVQGTDALHQRVRPPQGARPHRRPDALRRAHPRPRHRGETRPRPEHQDGRHAQGRIPADALDGARRGSHPRRRERARHQRGDAASCRTAIRS